MNGHSRGQQQKARSLIRGIFGHSSGWITKERASQLALGIVLLGTAAGKRNPRVDTNDFPRSPMVAAFIITAYHTLQHGPLDDPRTTSFDALTGAKTRQKGWINEDGTRGGSAALAKDLQGDPYPDDSCFLDGLPTDTTAKHRRGVPTHYKDLENRRRGETAELADRYRMVGLATLLGAGGGLRIDEVLGLRVRHFLSADQVNHIVVNDWDRPQSNFRGVLTVSEQASQASRGAIWITGTKGHSKSRTVHLPAFLPNWNERIEKTTRDGLAAVLPRFEDPSLSLWEATDEESVSAWHHG
jgi:integrase